MKHAFLTLLFAALLSDSLAQTPTATEDVRLYALWQGESKPYVALSCDTTAERIKSQKTWDPTTETIPLQPHEAAQIAKKWMLNQPNGTPNIAVESIRLRRCPKPFLDGWFYTIDFKFDQHRETLTRFAIVFFDGTVVEPKLHESPP